MYVVIEAPNDYAAACFKQYGMNTDASGRYSAMYKPFHLIGLELNISILSAALLGQPTGMTKGYNSDVIATAKRPLKAGNTWMVRVVTHSLGSALSSPDRCGY